MPIRTGSAVWQGNLKEGKGNVRTESGVLDSQYSFSSRFEEGVGTNPEELVAAAHAGCFSMALSAGLEAAGFTAEKITTEDKVHFQKVDDGFAITKIELITEAIVPGVEEDAFQEIAAEAKRTCPISKALAANEIVLNATLRES